MPQIHASSPLMPLIGINPNDVPQQSHLHRFMVHFQQHHFPLKASGPKGHHHLSFQFTSLHTTTENSVYPTNLVHAYKGKTQGLLVHWHLGLFHLVQCIKEGQALNQAMLTDLVVKLSLSKPHMGTNAGSKPIFCRKDCTYSTIVLYHFLE